MTEKISAWSPSTYGQWKECPRKVLFEKVRKLCPVCFTGKIKGGFNGEPIVCDSCDKDQPPREALDRGNKLDAALTLHVQQPTKAGDTQPKLEAAGVDPKAHSEALVEAVRHPAIAKLVKSLRKTKGVFTQARIVVDKAWNRLVEDPDRGIWARGVWGRMVLDVLVVGAKKARVIDYKSGNVVKKGPEAGTIRERSEYHDSMRLYQIGVLSSYPKVQEVTAEMAFLDAPPKLDDPFKRLPVLKRAELATAKATMEMKLQPMMSDTIFAPRPSYACTWCAFGKSKGGPCEFG